MTCGCGHAEAAHDETGCRLCGCNDIPEMVRWDAYYRGEVDAP